MLQIYTYSSINLYPSLCTHAKTCFSWYSFRFIHGEGATTTWSFSSVKSSLSPRSLASTDGEFVAFVTNTNGILLSFKVYNSSNNYISIEMSIIITYMQSFF